MSDDVEPRKRAPILVEGPVLSGATIMMYPITSRDVFSDVYYSVLENRSFIIPGPYQSGKTSFLWALDTKLYKKTNVTSIYLICRASRA